MVERGGGGKKMGIKGDKGMEGMDRRGYQLNFCLGWKSIDRVGTIEDFEKRLSMNLIRDRVLGSRSSGCTRVDTSD